MSIWRFEYDPDKVCFDHLGKHVPDSIKEEAKTELKRRGYNDKTIQEEEWKRM